MNNRNVAFFLIMIWCLLLCGFGCSTDATSDSDDTDSAAVADIAIGVSSSYVLTDNTDSITVSASVMDDNYAAISDATVSFSATGGLLSSATATTDESGIAEVTFSCGVLDKGNQQVVITAQSNGLSAQVPVSIAGTTITATSGGNTTLVAGADTDTLTVSVTDASDNPIYDADVTLSVSTSSSGDVSFSSDSGQTDLNGLFTVTVAGTNTGTAVVTISAAGATASQSYTVTGDSTSVSISAISSMSTSQEPTITVTDPSGGTVVLATTIGTLTSGANSGSSLILDASSGSATATLSSSTAGTATLIAYNTASPSVTDTTKIAIYAPASEAAHLSLQAGSSVVAPSTSTLTNTVELTATVTNTTGEAVGNAPVVFTLSDTTGGGEYLSPTIVFTDESGEATATFYSGTKSSGGDGVLVTAYLLNDDDIYDEIAITIGGTAGSVVIGINTTVSSVYNDTAYQMEIAVLVSDTNGNPVENATVSLGLWPTEFVITYITSTYDISEDTTTISYVHTWWENEDANQNTILDGEMQASGYYDGENSTYQEDNALTPGNSAAGNIPATVTTDEYGVANFTWTYLKTYAMWLDVELSASTSVLGSETSSVLNVVLPYAESDEDYLNPYSPWYYTSYVSVP